jgi:hypothetical protein
MTADEILRSFDFYRLATPERRAEYAAAVSTISLPEGVTFCREGDQTRRRGPSVEASVCS